MTTTLSTTAPVQGDDLKGLDFYLAQIPDEFSKLEASIKEVFKTGQQGRLSESRVQGWIDEMVTGIGVGGREGLTGSDLEDQIRDDIAKWVITKDVIMEVYGLSEEEAEQVILGGNEGGINFSDLAGRTGTGTTGAGGFIGGGELVKVSRGGQADLWGMKFSAAGGVEHIYTFGSEAEMEAILGDGAATSQGFSIVSEEDLNQGNLWVMGDAAMFAGQEGTYGAWWDDLVTETAFRSGVSDPGRLGDYMRDPEVARLMAQGAQAGWTGPQLQAELRKTDYYLNTLYPGIKNILDKGDTLNPEAAWKEYSATVEESLRLLGYEPDENGSYAAEIGRMLDAGIEQDDFVTIAPMFKRAQENPELAEALDFWLDDVAGRDVNFDDMFDAVAGLDTGELSDAIEKATIQFHANSRGTILTPDQIRRLADLSDLSEDQISRAFSSNEEAVLALGTRGLAKVGLTEQDLISAAFDIQAESGSTAVEIRRLAAKSLKELGLEDDDKASFFTGFNQQGRPIRTGLLAGAPEAG